jgi:hypothetical protein
MSFDIKGTTIINQDDSVPEQGHRGHKFCIIQIRLTDTQRDTIREWYSGHNQNDNGQSFNGLPYVDELTEEEIDHIMITGLWPEKYNTTTNSAQDDLYKECIQIVEVLKAYGDIEVLKQLKSELRKLEGVQNVPNTKTTYTTSHNATDPISFADLPTF